MSRNEVLVTKILATFGFGIFALSFLWWAIANRMSSVVNTPVFLIIVVVVLIGIHATEDGGN